MEERDQAEDLDAALERIIRDHNTIFHFHVAEFMAVHLSDCCDVFDGDLHEMLVFTVMAQRYLREQMILPDEEDALRDSRRVVSATRIAAQTGMPRETVRRKLAALQARGWVEKTGRAEWRIAVVNGHTAVKPALEDFVRREVRRVVKLGRALRPLL